MPEAMLVRLGGVCVAPRGVASAWRTRSPPVGGPARSDLRFARERVAETPLERHSRVLTSYRLDRRRSRSPRNRPERWYLLSPARRRDAEPQVL